MDYRNKNERLMIRYTELDWKPIRIQEITFMSAFLLEGLYISINDNRPVCPLEMESIKSHS